MRVSRTFEAGHDGDVVSARVEFFNDLSDRWQAPTNDRERQRKFRNVSSDVKQAVSDLELRHIFDKYRGTHTVSPSAGMVAGRYAGRAFRSAYATVSFVQSAARRAA